MDWLLLRGLSREQRHWGAFPDILRQKLPGATLHFLDLPGAGTEAHRPSPVTVRGIMEDVRARWLPLRAANKGPWGLLAMSLGGMVAMQWCADHPGDWARVALANTSAANVGRPWDRMSPRAVFTVVRVMFERDPVARERRVLSLVTRRRRDLDIVARQWAAIQRERPVSRLNVVRQLRAATVFRAPERLSVPALLLAGGRDVLASPACARALASRFGAPLHVEPESGHELSLDAPDWLAERLGAWEGQMLAGVAT